MKNKKSVLLIFMLSILLLDSNYRFVYGQSKGDSLNNTLFKKKLNKFKKYYSFKKYHKL